jgi:hypothetical protein
MIAKEHATQLLAESERMQHYGYNWRCMQQLSVYATVAAAEKVL